MKYFSGQIAFKIAVKTLVALIFLGPSAWAYSIDKISYNRASQSLMVTLSFEGGLKAHEFRALFDPCIKTTNPYQQAIRLVDTGWDDTGDNSLTENVEIDLSQSECLPAEVTVFISNRHATILVD